MLLLALSALAADPAGAALPARAAEASFTLAAPVAGLGVGPGLRLLGEMNVVSRLGVGAEVAVRLPSSAGGSLSHETLAEDLDWSTGLFVAAGGPRVSWTIGDTARLHGRVALAGGVAWMRESTFTVVGTTTASALTGWVCPEVGGALPLGPGWLTADLLVPIAPAPLLVLGDGPGGTAPALAVGYRLAL